MDFPSLQRIAFPSRCTVQAPQRAMPQPNLVPVSPRTSRKYQSNGRSGSPSKERATPFTFSEIMFAPPGRASAILFQRHRYKSNPIVCPLVTESGRPNLNKLDPGAGAAAVFLNVAQIPR